MKPPTTLNGHRGRSVWPRTPRFLNYEGELAVVVGRRMKGVPIDDALSYVAGYACANDVGMHDFRHADRGAMLRVKGQDGFLPLGPELVPAAEFDPTDYTLRTYLNGDVVQEATAGDLLFAVAYQLADLCRVITLEPGDVILTGTPANSRPMEPGDVVEVEITGLGRLDEHGRGVGRRPRRPGRAAPGLRADAPRRARDPGGRGRADGRGGPRPRAGGVIRLGRIDHVCLRVADLDEAAARWCIQLGLRRAGAGRRPAYLACNDEPYCLELAVGDEPATTTRPSSSHATARPTTPGRTSRSSVCRSTEREGTIWLADPDGRAIQLLPYRAPRAEVDRWPQHARPSRTVHVGGPRRLGHVNCLTGDIHAERRVLHRRARDAAVRLARRRRASGSTSTPSTT